MNKAIQEGMVEFVKQSGSWIPYEKIFEPTENDYPTKKYTTWIDDVGNGTKEIKDLFGEAVFDYAKSTELIAHFLKMGNVRDDDIVCDFFSGSATTAHAVLKMNLENKFNVSYIMIQLPERCDENSRAYKKGYRNICEIGLKRIELAGNEINQKINGQAIDTGVRVFKVNSSNMNDVFYDPTSTKKEILDYAAENIKSDRSGQDLLIQVMLELGIELSADIQEETIAGKTVFIVDGDYLIACFDSDVDDGLVMEIAKRQPRYAVFRDSSMSSDSVAINFGEIFKTFSPNTQTKVL